MQQHTVLKALKDAGYKFTRNRAAIVNLFVAQPNDSFTVKDIYDAVVQEYCNISLDTIYRTLALLQEHEMIEPVGVSDGVSRYQLACEQHHHHHLICLKCGHTAVIRDCPVPRLEMNYGDFTPIRHRFDVYGYCAACASHSSQ